MEPYTKDEYMGISEFSKWQSNIDKFSDGSEYYCGGNSSLALRGMEITNTPLSEMYFSEKNINHIQKMIKREVINRSHGKYKMEVDQDISDLLIVMRYIYLDYAKNLPKDTIKQLKVLNKILINYMMPDLMTNLKQDVEYLKVYDKPREILNLPIDTNHSGRRTLPSITTIWSKP